MAQLDWYIRANLKPRHLQLLVALDDLRNTGRAAEHLNISQPAVSKALAEMEKFSKFTQSELVNTAVKRFIAHHKDFLPQGFMLSRPTEAPRGR